MTGARAALILFVLVVVNLVLVGGWRWALPGALLAGWLICAIDNVRSALGRLWGSRSYPLPIVGLMAGLVGLVLAPLRVSRETAIGIVGVMVFVEALGLLGPVVDYFGALPKSKRG